MAWSDLGGGAYLESEGVGEDPDQTLLEEDVEVVRVGTEVGDYDQSVLKKYLIVLLLLKNLDDHGDLWLSHVVLMEPKVYKA